jgi:hypothetical protein
MYNPEYTDPYGQDTYETEEERRRRLAAEAEANMPTKQTITYDNKTGAQKVKIEGSATNLSSMNPATPTVAGPVNPDDTYQRILQAESGGRQFNAQGGVLTSPKGAMGVGQVMPATAMQPGYGVPNIFDLAQQRGVPVPSRDTAGAQQLLGNEQLNREFGQNYFNAMQQRFPQDPNAAVAAYNAGPGRVGQNMQANAGQLNTAQLPNETQAYIQKVMNRMPQAQAQQPQPIIDDQGQVVGAETPAQMVAGAQTNAPIAQGPVDPNAQTSMVQTQAATAPQPGPVGEQMGPPTSAMTLPGWAERYSSALDNARNGDFGSLQNMIGDPNLPKGAKMEAIANMADNMRFKQMADTKTQEFTRGLETGDFKSMQREDRKTDGGGSWLRYIMFGLLGSPSAQIEKQRLMPELFAKPDYVTLTDGQTQAVIMRDDNGNAIRGTTADGRALTQKELVEAGALGGTPKFKSDVSMQDVEAKIGDKTIKGRVATIYDSKGRGKTVVESGGKQYAYDDRWKPTSIGTAAEKATAQKQINLAYDGVIEAVKKGGATIGETNARFGTNIQVPRYENGQPVIIDGNTGQRITGTAGGQVTVTANKTPADLEAEQAGKVKKTETVSKAEGEQVVSDMKNQRFADSTYGLLKPIDQEIRKSTGSGIGTGVDTLASAFGKSTQGAQAIAKLEVYSYQLLSNVPRFEGPQSNLDVEIYKQAAGDLGNSSKPIATRLAALQAIVTILKKYDKEGKNDWSFGGGSTPGAQSTPGTTPGQPGGAPVIIKREKI